MPTDIFVGNLILNNFYVYIFLIERVIFETSVKSENFHNFSISGHVKLEAPTVALSVVINYLNIFWVLKFKAALIASVSTCLF